jgi:hypothetical protein
MVPSPPATMTFPVLMRHNTFILAISSIPVVVYSAIQSFLICKSEAASIISDLSILPTGLTINMIFFFKVLFLLLMKNN